MFRLTKRRELWVSEDAMPTKKKDGRKGSTSAAKRLASRRNGKLGGRPRYVRLEIGEDIDQWERWRYSKELVEVKVIRLDKGGAEILVPGVEGAFGARKAEMKDYPAPGIYLLRPGIKPKWKQKQPRQTMVEVELELLWENNRGDLAEQYEWMMDFSPGRAGRIHARAQFKQWVRDGKLSGRSLIKWHTERHAKGEVAFKTAEEKLMETRD